MKKIKFSLCFLFVFFSVFLIIFYKIRAYNNKEYTNLSVREDVVKDDNKVVSDNLPIQNKNVEIYQEKIFIEKPFLEEKQNNIEIIDLKNKFEKNNFVVKKIDNNFTQISKTNINTGEIPYDDCFLNLYYQNNLLDICDFVKKECVDLECKNFDCELYKNNWYKVAYYGDFIGSGDKQLLYKNSENIIIANLECGDKKLEDYENKLFQNLIN